MLNANRHDNPQEIYSWVYYPPDIAVKRLDRSAFLHHGSGVPVEMRPFFGAEKMAVGSRRELTLRHINVDFTAYVEMRETVGVRTRLFWHSGFSGQIQNHFTRTYRAHATRTEIHDETPLMRLQCLNADRTLFSVEFVLPHEILLDVESEQEPEGEPRLEGAVRYFYGKQYERDPENRRKAIEIHGATCRVCGFDFERHYGERGMGFIEIHHTKPLSSATARIIVNPRTDLVPVCSNCHRMIHRRKDDVLSPDQMRTIWKRAHEEKAL